MLKSILQKLFLFLLKLIILYYIGSSFLFESAFAEELSNSSDKGSVKVEDACESTKSSAKSYSDILWEYRWYILGGGFLLATSLVFWIYLSGGEVPPITEVNHNPMPHVPGQMITDLLAIRPDVHMDAVVSSNMPDLIQPDSQFFAPKGSPVADPNFIKGFTAGRVDYLVYMMPETAYDQIAAEFWINKTLTTLGSPIFPADTTIMYTKVAVLPVDSINYTVYHKVDIVRIIPDPGHNPIPQVRASVYYKDNEIQWA